MTQPTPNTQPTNPTPPSSRAIRLRLASAMLALAAGITALIIVIALVHTTLLQ